MGMRTTLAVEAATRDAVAAYVKETGSTSVDEALRTLLWEHDCNKALARLDADPQLLAEYRAESLMLAEVDVAVVE